MPQQILIVQKERIHSFCTITFGQNKGFVLMAMKLIVVLVQTAADVLHRISLPKSVKAKELFTLVGTDAKETPTPFGHVAKPAQYFAKGLPRIVLLDGLVNVCLDLPSHRELSVFLVLDLSNVPPSPFGFDHGQPPFQTKRVRDLAHPFVGRLLVVVTQTVRKGHAVEAEVVMKSILSRVK